MELVEIPLNRYRYNFRQLKWPEETRLKFLPGEDQRKVILAAALVDISGLPIAGSDSRKVINAIPESVLWRIWVLYRGNLPSDRYFSSGGLYQAPDQNTHAEQNRLHEEQTEDVADRAFSEVERQFGVEGVEEARNITHRMFETARREGKLIPVKETS
jgi:hypothetical protein